MLGAARSVAPLAQPVRGLPRLGQRAYLHPLHDSIRGPCRSLSTLRGAGGVRGGDLRWLRAHTAQL